MSMRRTFAITLFALAAVAFASTDSYGCWTCAPGWVHWYDLAWSAPSNGDKCQCVKSTSTVITTKAPTSAPTPNCWTCAAGWVHWYDIAGMAEPSDPCACVLASSTTTTKSPVTTSTKTPASTSSCWTCPAGYTHWYDLGMAEPADPCACVATSGTTVVPTATHDCWTCAAGWVHWYDIEGMAQPSDPCACVQSSSPATTTTTTKAPVTTTTTTKSPTTTSNCWTCAAGWVHWYDIAGMAEPSDPCACVQSGSSVVTTTTTKSPAVVTTTTTTKSPTTTSNCWTCAAGWVHWYDIAGMAEPSDPCACVQSGSSVVTTSTSSPAVTSKPGSTASPTTAMAKFIDAMTPSSTTTGSISFSPGIGSYSPSNPPPLSLVGSLMDNLIAQTKYRTIMTYYIDSYTTPLAAARGLKMLGIIYIVPGTDNSALINTAIAAAKAYPDTIVAIACGNEMGANYGLVSSVVSAVSQCSSMLRAAGLTQPIGVIDTYYSWCSQNEAACNTPWTAVSQYVDWIGLNDYGFWDNEYSGVTPCNSPTSAPTTTLNKHKKIQAMYGKQVVLTESGWPSAPSGSSITMPPNDITGQQCSTANAANQQTFVQTLVNVYRAAGMPCNTFEAFQEPWKGTSNTDPNRYWGICTGTSAPVSCWAPQ